MTAEPTTAQVSPIPGVRDRRRASAARPDRRRATRVLVSTVRGCSATAAAAIATSGSHAATPRSDTAEADRPPVPAIGSYRPGGWRTTKPENSPPPWAQRVPLEASATVSKRQPATVIQAWLALA